MAIYNNSGRCSRTDGARTKSHFAVASRSFLGSLVIVIIVTVSVLQSVETSRARRGIRTNSKRRVHHFYMLGVFPRGSETFDDRDVSR